MRFTVGRIVALECRGTFRLDVAERMTAGATESEAEVSIMVELGIPRDVAERAVKIRKSPKSKRRIE